ncbi:MAG TPA: diguanylate cyclase [Clostridia bacterium]|nr:diguanylate cyclase [Clostridia bacterium]
MQTAYQVQNIAVGLFLLALIFVNLLHHGIRRKHSQSTFLAMLTVNALLLVLDFCIVSLSGKTDAFSRGALPAAVAVYYMLGPVLAALMVLYLYHLIRREQTPKPAFLFALLLPAVLNVLFSLISLKTDFTFSIAEGNVYERGAYFALMPAICYCYMTFYLATLWYKRASMLKKEFYLLLFSALLPMAAGLTESFFDSLNVVWLTFSLAFLLIYISMQNIQVYTDYLTGLYNRRKFDAALESYFSSGSKRKRLCGVMVDIDRFKQINDHYGHDMGDSVLKSVAEVLRRSARRKDLVARIGGDEFAVLFSGTGFTTADVHRNILLGLKALNERGVYPFEISLSLGSETCGVRSYMTQREFYKRLDSSMYEQKRFNSAPRTGAR